MHRWAVSSLLLTLCSPALAAPDAQQDDQQARVVLAQASSPRSSVRQADKFFSQNGAVVHRITDRLFVSGATDNDGAFPNRIKDWLAALQTAWGNAIGYTVPAAVNVLTSNSESSSYAIVGGAQTRYFRHAGAAAIGVQGHGIANNSSYPGTHAWGFYGEAHRTVAGAGSAYGMELDPVGHTPSIAPTPLQQGDLVGLQYACGGAYTGIVQHDCSAAMQIAANGASFMTGLNVMAGSIAPGKPAIQLPAGNGIGFFDRGGRRGGNIDATFTTGQTSNLTFTDRGLLVSGSDGSAVAYFAPLASGANHLVLRGGKTGEAAAISAEGEARDVDLQLAPKGGGTTTVANLRLNPTTYGKLPACTAASAGSLGYITDAKEAISAWHQRVASGGGRNKAFVSCNGEGWFAFGF